MAPLIAEPARFHTYVMVPAAPSSSVTVAVSTWPSVAVPEIATEASSLMLETAEVAPLVTDSAVPWSSVHETVTDIAEPTSSCPRV